jgi:hypothetical protein
MEAREVHDYIASIFRYLPVSKYLGEPKFEFSGAVHSCFAASTSLIRRNLRRNQIVPEGPAERLRVFPVPV